MKRVYAIVLVLVLCLGFAACGQRHYVTTPGVTEGVVIKLDGSNYAEGPNHFSSEERWAAVDCVLKQFPDFKGCTLQELWYFEDWSQAGVEEHLTNGRGSINGVAPENVIVLYSNFTTVDDPAMAEYGFNAGAEYTNWKWIVIRDSKDGDWRLDDYGY